MSKEFVVFNAEGKEVDWVDPYVSHREEYDHYYEVFNTFGSHVVVIPPGGYFQIREMEEDDA